MDTQEETVIWSGRTTAAFQFTKALIPLILVLPLSFIGEKNAGMLLALIGFSVTVVLSIVYLYEMDYIETRKSSLVSINITTKLAY